MDITRYAMSKKMFGGVGGGSGVTIKNQNKTITENGTYTADSGYTGLGTVTVDVQASGGTGEGGAKIATGTITPVAKVTSFTHNLGVIPDYFIWYIENNENISNGSNINVYDSPEAIVKTEATGLSYTASIFGAFSNGHFTRGSRNGSAATDWGYCSISNPTSEKLNMDDVKIETYPSFSIFHHSPSGFHTYRWFAIKL